MAELPIEDFPGYTVDDTGKVWQEGQKEPLKETISHDGYSLVKLWRNGKPFTKRVDRLVLEAFKPLKRTVWCSPYGEKRGIVATDIPNVFYKK